ncbi:MAG: CarD family transcriptional regulator [Anaerolineaceae bacterium]
MSYKIGDVIIHWTYGIGTIVAIEEKTIGGEARLYYAIEVELFKYWVPVEESDTCAIHTPIESDQFEPLFDILRTPGENLPDHQYERKNELRERMHKKTLGDLCHVIRDLTDRSHSHNLNLDDSFVLNQAKEHLLDEWVLSFGVQRSNAQDELKVLLQGDSILV